MRLPALRRLVRLPWRSASRIAEDVDDEFRFHLEMRARELRERGVEPDEAARQALRRFGDVDDARDYCRRVDTRYERERRRRDWAADLAYDVRHALRQMARSPGVTLLAAVTLALGIGATTAIFSVVDRLLLDPIPIANGERIVRLNLASKDGTLFISPPTELVDEWQKRSRAAERVTTSGWRDATLASGDEIENIKAGEMSSGLLTFLGARPLLGRGFLAEETKPGAPKVVMVSYGFWLGRLGGESSALGRTLRVDGDPYTIVGVLPRDFSVPFTPAIGQQVWLPLVPAADGHGAPTMVMLRPGATREQLQREVAEVIAARGRQGKGHEEFRPVAMRPQDLLGQSTRDTLVILLGAVGIVLLIACANVANVLLARATVRRREFVVRSALGAERGRIVRQLLTESCLLALLGGAAGLAVARGALALIVRLRPEHMDELAAVRLEPGVLAGSLALSVLTGVLFGLAPAIFAAERRLGDMLRSGGRHAAGHRRSALMRSSLVTAEVSLSVVLLVGAGLLVRTLVGMNRAPIGFEPSALHTVQVRLPEQRYESKEARRAVLDEIRARVATIDGIRETTWALDGPIGDAVTFGSFHVEGRSQPTEDRAAALGFNAVSPDFFRVAGIPLQEGRSFDAHVQKGDAVVIVNASLARRYWPGESAVGRRIRLSDDGEWSTVIGVAGDVTIPTLGGTRFDRRMYVPFDGMLDGGNGEAMLLIRTRGRETDLAPAIVRTVGAIDPAIRVRQLLSAEVSVAREMARPRFNMVLLASFAAVALVLAAVGLYGVIAYSVSQRMREMGIRLALGARPMSVLRLVLSEGARLTAVGLAAGLAAAAASTRVMRTMLYGVEPLDLLTFVGVSVLLGAVALVAASVPAMRATRVDPAVTLREE